MKKTILFLGIAAMISVTPVFAATKVGAPVVAKHTETMCVIHGKKGPCAHHVMHKSHKGYKTQVLAKKK
jgi:hypothetical protein